MHGNSFKITNLDTSYKTCTLYLQVQVKSVHDTRGDVNKLSKVLANINGVNHALIPELYPVFSNSITLDTSIPYLISINYAK